MLPKYFLWLMLLFFAACRGERKEHQSAPALDKVSFTTVENGRFNFKFLLPDNWTSVDSSSNGDGFFIQTGNREVQIQVYGQYMIPDLPVSQCVSTDIFVFVDGDTGTICYLNDMEYYIRRSNETVELTLHVKASQDWMSTHQVEIKTMAQSIDFILPTP